ncbi:MAG: hypothetical protein JSW03_04290 [Candidatus Eiseniibacteriota bacterium]|nr:MAG: hypothetical protein JSW03_04290 [Candidatus Eisenbacteria bacterium]
MSLWLAVAGIGVVLAVGELVVLLRKFRLGEVSRRYFLAVLVGFDFFVLFAVLRALRPDIVTGPVTAVLLLPVFVSIVIVVREHQSK